MDLFTTDIRLNCSANTDKVWNLLKTWLVESPKYEIDDIDYSGEDFFKQEYENCSVSILSFFDCNCRHFALHFELKQEDNSWITDCIYTEKCEKKNLTITLSCHTNDYSSDLPDYHKPHLIKQLIESGLCYNDGYFPISDVPVYLTNDNLEICADIINGCATTNLPIVYISYKDRSPINSKKLARELSGIAHILVEPNKTFSKKLKDLTYSNNPYMGYVGIYFPNSTYHETVSTNKLIDKKEMTDIVKKTLQQAVLNHNPSKTSWYNLQVMFHRKKYESAAQDMLNAEKERDEFISAFDGEIKEKDEKIRYLQEQLNKKSAIVESYEKGRGNKNSIDFGVEDIEEFYYGELNDLIISLLLQIQPKTLDASRQRELLDLFLFQNKLIGNGKRILEDIEKALKEKSTPAKLTKLKNCGFDIEEGGSHYKLIFHHPKYNFSLSSSPSDDRGSKNLLSDICKKIDIYKDIMK